MKRFLLLTIFTLCLALLATSVQAATISFSDQLGGTDLDPAVGSASVDTDGTILKTYLKPEAIFMTVTGVPLPQPPAATSTFTVTEEITNSTQYQWSKFVWELVDSPNVSFAASSPGYVSGSMLAFENMALNPGGVIDITYDVVLSNGATSFIVQQTDDIVVPAPGAGVALVGLSVMFGVGGLFRRRKV